MENWQQTVLSQYANSPRILALIQEFNACIDPAANITAFYNNIWNVATATGYGLDVWGRIVGIKRRLTISGGSKFLGYQEATPASADPFGQSPLYSGTPATQNYTIGDAQYQSLIMLKALMNISKTSIPTYNTVLRSLFAGRGGNVYISDRNSVNQLALATFGFAEATGAGVTSTIAGFNQAPLYGSWDQPVVYQDTGGMNVRITAEFLLQPLDIAILSQSGLLSRPTGVEMEIMDVDLLGGVFGFSEAGTTCAVPFNQGALFPGFSIVDATDRGSGVTDQFNFEIVDQNGFALTTN